MGRRDAGGSWLEGSGIVRGRGEWMVACFNARSSQSMGAAQRSDILTEKHSATILQED